MDINIWLRDFKKFWLEKDIESILDLFSNNVEYYENPFLKFKNKNEIEAVWKNIYKQDISFLEFEVFSREDSKFTIKWSLKYFNEREYVFEWIYLLTLNSNNKCNYFIQYGHKKQK